MPSQKEIYDKLKTAIIYGELSPGEKLSEMDLAKKMAVSRTPIREAFRQLQTEGYITVIANRGAFVGKLPVEEIEEIYDIVSLLEGYAAGVAAKIVTQSDLKELEKLQKQLVDCVKKRNYHDYIKNNTAWHDLIVRLSGNRTLAKLTTELRMRIYRYRLMSVTIPGYLEEYVSYHRNIINAFKKKNSMLAREHMRKHVDFVKEKLVRFMRDNPGY